MLGNWNVLTLTGKELELVEEARKYHLDIVGVSSIKRRGSGIVDLGGGWKIFCLDAVPSMSVQAGVGILTSPQMSDRVFDFEVAYVIPIPTTLSPKSPDEFCPISLLSVFSKLFEQILKNNLLEFIDKNNILTSFQFGFKANNSTELAITSFYDNLLNSINESKTTCTVFPELRKAFDCVNHSILLKKLYHYGFRWKIFNFLTSFLTDRQICSKIGSSVFSGNC